MRFEVQGVRVKGSARGDNEAQWKYCCLAFRISEETQDWKTGHSGQITHIMTLKTHVVSESHPITMPRLSPRHGPQITSST